jgi:hypothetical protein
MDRGLFEQIATFAEINLAGTDKAARARKLDVIAALYPAPFLLVRDILTKMVGDENFDVTKKSVKKQGLEIG